jgi:ATP-binding cassette subfamily B protein
MVGKPQVYLLDEITSSLDEQNAREMEEILLAEDAMVLYVCHKIIPELKGQYEMLTF